MPSSSPPKSRNRRQPSLEKITPSCRRYYFVERGRELHFAGLNGELRRQISETINSLSVSDRVRSIPGIFSGDGRQVLETLWFESESQPRS